MQMRLSFRIAARVVTLCVPWFFVTGILLVWALGTCAAQESRPRPYGYVFAAPGLRTHERTAFATFQAGGGGEAFVSPSIAVGAELSYLAFADAMSNGIGVLSFDAAYHRIGDGKLEPFVAGGYSRGFRSQSPHLLNFGLGATYWFGERAGLRLDVRDHFFPDDADDHYLSFRLGIALR